MVGAAHIIKIDVKIKLVRKRGQVWEREQEEKPILCALSGVQELACPEGMRRITQAPVPLPYIWLGALCGHGLTPRFPIHTFHLQET